MIASPDLCFVIFFFYVFLLFYPIKYLIDFIFIESRLDILLMLINVPFNAMFEQNFKMFKMLLCTLYEVFHWACI